MKPALALLILVPAISTSSVEASGLDTLLTIEPTPERPLSEDRPPSKILVVEGDSEP